MHKFLARLLILMLGLSACGKSIYASSALLSADTENRREGNGSLVAARDGGATAPREPVTLASALEHSGDAEDAPSGQASPSPSQNSPRYHDHHLRNILIGIGIALGLAVIFAVAAK